MKPIIAILGFALTQLQVARAADPTPPPANPAIDMAEHIRVTKEAAEHRESRRVTEDEFIRMSREPNTVVLDARSRAKYDLLHVKGAINLSFPDISIDSVAEAIPDKTTRILIYCNNNFKNSPAAFAPKGAFASLNLATYTTLFGYGYRNVYELAPLLDPKESKLTFESTAKH